MYSSPTASASLPFISDDPLARKLSTCLKNQGFQNFPIAFTFPASRLPVGLSTMVPTITTTCSLLKASASTKSAASSPPASSLLPTPPPDVEDGDGTSSSPFPLGPPLPPFTSFPPLGSTALPSANSDKATCVPASAGLLTPFRLSRSNIVSASFPFVKA